jgi:hypothetical protein
MASQVRPHDLPQNLTAEPSIALDPLPVGDRFLSASTVC